MKSLKYYIDTEVITEIGARWGNSLQRLSNTQKFELIGYLGIWVAEVLDAGKSVDIEWKFCREIEGEPDTHVAAILDLCNEMMTDEVCVFIGAITEMVTV